MRPGAPRWWRARRGRRLAALVAGAVESVERPLIGVLGTGTEAGADLRDRLALLEKAEVVDLAADGRARHVQMAARERFDVVVDCAGREGSRVRFSETLFHVRPGGKYVVPGAARAMRRGTGELAELLATAAAHPAEVPPLPWKLPRGEALATLRDHVTREVRGRDLVLSHDVPHALAKLREEDTADYVRLSGRPYRVLTTLPAATPDLPPGRIGPVAARRNKYDDLPMVPVAPALREYLDVVAAPEQLLVDDRAVLPDSFRHNQWDPLTNRGLVHASGSCAIPLPDLTGLTGELPVLGGTYLHLDNEVRGHFGHLLTESVSRAWTWPLALEIDPDARVLLGAARRRPDLLPYEVEVYEACGIPRDRIDLIDRPVRVERVISGTPLFSHPHYVHPVIAATWSSVGDRLEAGGRSADGPGTWPRRLFLSRRGPRRVCVNADELERVFLDHGFEVRYPEDYPLADQVAMFRAADVIAGYTGSGMFQLMFAPDVRRVIVVGSESYHPRNEHLIAAVHGQQIDKLTLRSLGEVMNSDVVYDEERDGAFLREILADLPD